MVYCIGLTGNIASGKSTVAGFFRELGIQVLNADQISRQLTVPGTYSYKQIAHRYGSSVIGADHQLDRKKLRAIIFADIQERLWLEQLLHPQIRKQIAQEVALCTTPYCVIEIPLLMDKKHYPYLNRVLLVLSPIEVQIQRIISRDQCTEEQARAIIAAQPAVEHRKGIADDILVNEGDLEYLKREVLKLHQHYLKTE